LEFGYLREAAAPRWDHQATVTRLTVLLDQHVGAAGSGRVCVSPLDIVLDEARALVVQPDVIFLSAERAHLVRGQVWGAPDLVIEVLSPATRTRDGGVKLGWYRRYGVREVWLVDLDAREVRVIDGAGDDDGQAVAGSDRVPSTVLPALDMTVASIFDEA
jgi:Uma2 family endonuclease